MSDGCFFLKHCVQFRPPRQEFASVPLILNLPNWFCCTDPLFVAWDAFINFICWPQVLPHDCALISPLPRRLAQVTSFFWKDWAALLWVSKIFYV